MQTYFQPECSSPTQEKSKIKQCTDSKTVDKNFTNFLVAEYLLEFTFSLVLHLSALLIITLTLFESLRKNVFVYSIKMIANAIFLDETKYPS